MVEQSTGPTACIYCSCQMETLKHCLWECHATQQVWRRVFRVLAFMFKDCSFLWGMVVWTIVAQVMWPYEACPNDTIIRIQRGMIMVVQWSHMEAPYMLKVMQEVWELLGLFGLLGVLRCLVILLFIQWKVYGDGTYLERAVWGY